MLAENFKTCEELQLTAQQHDALITVLSMLERGELVHISNVHQNMDLENVFNMDWWTERKPCGTVGCIGGWAQTISGDKNLFDSPPTSIMPLFYPSEDNMDIIDYGTITVPQAARALRNYLTFGEPRWLEVVS